MKRFNAYMFHVAVALWVAIAASWVATGQDIGHPGLVLLVIFLGLYGAALDDGVRFVPRLVWQSPALFRNAGLFLKCGDRRWRLLRVG